MAGRGGIGGGALTVGPDSNLWITEANTSLIARMTLSGTVTDTLSRRLNSGLRDIAPGPDGNVWFGEFNAAICRITPAGVITEFQLADAPSSSVSGVVDGPDGNVWFIDYKRGLIGRIAP